MLYSTLSFLLILGTFLFTANPVFASSLPVDLTNPQPGPYTLKQQDSLSFRFPAVPKNRSVHLSWEARVNTRRQGGSSFQLKLLLNNQEITGIHPTLPSRLLNKPISFPHKKSVLYWYALHTGWRIAHAPSFSPVRPLLGHSNDDYLFVLDITDLSHSDSANELIFQRLIGKLFDDLIIRNISITYHDNTGEFSRKTSSSAQNAIENNKKISFANLTMDNIAPHITSEALGIRLGSHTLQLSSFYTMPGGQQMKLPGAENPASRSEGKLETADFSVQRRAHWEAGRLSIEETVTNRQAHKPLALRITHRLEFASLAVKEVRFGGRADPWMTQSYNPANPTLYVQLDPINTGIVLEDDVMRAQHELIAEPQMHRIGWQTNQFVLAAGAQHTFRYSWYVATQGDYFTFINRIRHDWKVPRRLDGPLVLMFKPDAILDIPLEQLQREIARLGIKGFSSAGGWKDPLVKEKNLRTIGFGAGVMMPFFANYRSRLQQTALLIQKAAPDIYRLLYSHMHLHSPESPQDDKNFSREWMTLPNGKRFFRSSSDFKSVGGIIPEADGQFGQAFRQVIAQLLPELHYNGIYLDESNSGGNNAWTYNRYDGVSGDIDFKTNKIVQTKASGYLIGLPYRLAFYQWLQKQNYFLLANGPPVTMAENQTSFFRMAETHKVPHRAYETHLYTPLVYTSPNPSMEVIRERLMMGTIPFRVAPGAASTVLKYFFPITIEALGQGYIIGEERVITAISGDFRPADTTAKSGELFLFDKQGSLLSSQDVSLTTAIHITVPDNGLAVLLSK